MDKKILKNIGYLGVFLFITGISYYLFDFLIPSGSEISLSPSGNKVTKDEKTGDLSSKTSAFSGPKTEICPLNGQLYTKEEKAIWSKRRPLTVMIENHEEARPQSGLQSADIVYEAVAEGGITRFMGVFYCGIVATEADSENKYDVGPVRSARTYFLDIASEYADYPLYNHVGGANCSAADAKSPCTTNTKAQAIEQIAKYGWNNQGTWGDLSQFSLSYKACRREPDRTGQDRATEHTMYCSSSELYNIAANRGLTNMTEVKKTAWDKSYQAWKFTQKDTSAGSSSTIAFDFWSGYKAYSVSWKYDPSLNLYSRSNGGKEHIDFNTQKAITAKNIVIQYTKESRSIDEHGHNLYEMIGTGKGILFQNGTKTEITWSKANRIARTIFKDSSNKEVNFIPGNIWVEILPLNTSVSYENSN
ncbi:MAG: DUF3048 domain-containing protein [Candidatus Shapirobacteria bacterium]|nr:DUF3048 domain-containing protein [Candidatus Shapirobacteria bacterium]MDD4410660.1 DUF3048 domain-containing protein [Candidatus Shapirobacteria bacterium]